MNILSDFSEWMQKNSNLADSSIYKYQRAINTISNEMLAYKVINKSLLTMNLFELDIAIMHILSDDSFVRKNKTGNNMYSNALKQFRFFCADTKEAEEDDLIVVEKISESQTLTDTEKQIIIKARKGQGIYRNKLLRKYDSKCIVTGVDNSNLLIASHIKPWRICNNDERIDVENGLILCPNVDRLFDYGLITFKNDGQMIISSYVSEQNIRRLNISSERKVDLKASNRLLRYLEYHRDILFVK